MSRVTLKDVAVHAGVSHQTVSNVLNNHPSIRPLTRERVLHSVRALEYQPNQAAKALREARVTTLCCAFAAHNADDVTDLYRNLIQAAFIAEARAHGYSMTTTFINDEASLLKLRQDYQQRLFGGVVVVGSQEQLGSLQELNAQGLKMVLFDAGTPQAGLSAIDADYVGGMRRLVEHHYHCGRRHLALIAPTTNPGKSGQARIDSFMQTTKALGVSSTLVAGDWSSESGEQALYELWQKPVRPDAVLAASDRMAAGALRAAHLLKISVPEQLAISGFDDLEIAQYTHPNLTTVRVPFAQMARQAVRQLLSQDLQTLTFSTELIIRESA